MSSDPKTQDVQLEGLTREIRKVRTLLLIICVTLIFGVFFPEYAAAISSIVRHVAPTHFGTVLLLLVVAYLAGRWAMGLQSKLQAARSAEKKIDSGQ